MIDRLLIPMALSLAAMTACRDDDAQSPNDSAGGSKPSAGGTSGGVQAISSGGALGGTGAGQGGGAGSSAGGGDLRGGGPDTSGGRAGAGTSEAGGPPNAGAGGGDLPCSPDVTGLRINSNWDEFGYPGYAVDACRLLYVAEDGSLRLRTLDDRTEVELESATNRPRRPVLDGDTLAWEVRLDETSQVRVWTAHGAVTLAGNFHHAGEPVASNGVVAFTAFKAAGLAADSDVLAYDVGSGVQSEVFGGPGQQRFPAISKSHIAASDFSEDPSGVFDELGSLSDIIVRPRAGGVPVTRRRQGKQAFPMLSDDGTLAYLEWGAVHPEPKFSAFTLYVAEPAGPVSNDVKVRAIETDPSYVRPSLRDGGVDFVDRSEGTPRLYRQALNAASLPSSVDFGASVPLGPIARPTFTLIGTRSNEGAQLRVLAR